MPCFDGTDWDEIERKSLERRLNRRTAMLCRVLHLVEEGNPRLMKKLNKATLRWFKAHKRFDAKRKGAG